MIGGEHHPRRLNNFTMSDTSLRFVNESLDGSMEITRQNESTATLYSTHKTLPSKPVVVADFLLGLWVPYVKWNVSQYIAFATLPVPESESFLFKEVLPLMSQVYGVFNRVST